MQRESIQPTATSNRAAFRTLGAVAALLLAACGSGEEAGDSTPVAATDATGDVNADGGATGASMHSAGPQGSSEGSAGASGVAGGGSPASGNAGAGGVAEGGSAGNPGVNTGDGGTAGGQGGASGEGDGGSAGTASGGGSAAAGMAGEAAGGSGGAAPEPIDCSESELRTGPPPGKEMFRADPIDDQFPFALHYMGTFSDDPRYVSMTSFSDIDNDGDLDFASGQRQDVGGGMIWWEYCSPDHWVPHAVGTGHTSAAGGNAADVDADGWVDLIAGDSWYRNPTTPRESEWERFEIGSPGAEEVIVGDVTGDGQEDVLWVWRTIDPQIHTPGANPEALWEQVAAFSHRQQQGGAIGDIDGDGDNDVLVGNEWWYRNVDGDGSSWEDVNIEVGADFDDAPLAHVGDMDSDGDIDLVMCTHFGNRIAWVENVDGDGTDWNLHVIADDKEYLHAIVAADFDNDGDVDVFAGQNVGPSWIMENDGAGSFTEHAIAMDARGHEARVGDVDCDGDLDIAGKPWGDPGEGGEAELTESRDHVYFRNMLVENGGPAQFGPTEGEVWHDIQERDCR